MKILYISNLSHSPSTGPAWSVPASVDAQSKLDDVLWVEVSNNFQPQWGKVSAYHNIKEYCDLSLKSLPAPFNKPDVVVFEGFYDIKSVFFSYELRRKGIPYIIIPRCSLTKQALHNSKWLKKYIAHIIFFNSFTKHALAIQYLTQAEFADSGTKWNKNNFIVPNGTSMPLLKKESFSDQSIKALFIGRIDIYQKGLDLLVEACEKLRNELKNAKFSITCYGPDMKDYKTFKQLIFDKKLEDIILLEGGAILGEEKKQAILEADVFIMTSRFEGLPMGLIEALSYGLPCLITRGTNMLPEVESSDSGWTCENNVDSISNALMRLISDKQLLAHKSQNARNLANKYDWNELAERFHNYVSDLVNATSKE